MGEFSPVNLGVLGFLVGVFLWSCTPWAPGEMEPSSALWSVAETSPPLQLLWTLRGDKQHFPTQSGMQCSEEQNATAFHHYLEIHILYGQ